MEGLGLAGPGDLVEATMTQAAHLAIAATTLEVRPAAFAEHALRQENRALRAELDELEPVVSAAVLTATAFRLRDHEALITALRTLVRVIRMFEDARACA